MIRWKIILTYTIAIIILTGAGAASAGESWGKTDQQVRIERRHECQDAALAGDRAAEQETGGKAVEIGLEDQDGVMAYEIKIAKGDILQKVLVDVDFDKITKVMAADDDHENGEHGDQEEEGEHESK
jgi:hypothetical protein